MPSDVVGELQIICVYTHGREQYVGIVPCPMKQIMCKILSQKFRWTLFDALMCMNCSLLSFMLSDPHVFPDMSYYRMMLITSRYPI